MRELDPFEQGVLDIYFLEKEIQENSWSGTGIPFKLNFNGTYVGRTCPKRLISAEKPAEESEPSQKGPIKGN